MVVQYIVIIKLYYVEYHAVTQRFKDYLKFSTTTELPLQHRDVSRRTIVKLKHIILISVTILYSRKHLGM